MQIIAMLLLKSAKIQSPEQEKTRKKEEGQGYWAFIEPLSLCSGAKKGKSAQNLRYWPVAAPVVNKLPLLLLSPRDIGRLMLTLLLAAASNGSKFLLETISLCTHTNNRLMALCLGLPGLVSTKRNIHPLTPILTTNHPLSTSPIYYNP